MGFFSAGPAGGGGVTEIDISVSTTDETPTVIWADTDDGPRNILVEVWVAQRETGLSRAIGGTGHIVASTFQSSEATWTASYTTLPADDPQSPSDDRLLQASVDGSGRLQIQVIGLPATDFDWVGKLVIRDAA